MTTLSRLFSTVTHTAATLCLVTLLVVAAALLSGCQTSAALGELTQTSTVPDEQPGNPGNEQETNEDEPPQQDFLGLKLFGAIADTLAGIDALSAAIVKRANYSIERIGTTLLIVPDAAAPLALPPADTE